MGKAKNAAKSLTHEEIWDDSALIRSWDEAVEEYKLYHSIHAKGENVEDVLREAQDAAEPPDQDDYMDEEIESPAEGSKKRAKTGSGQDAHGPRRPEGGTQIPGEAPAGAWAAPQAVFEQVQDEGLKNLMMSWYFAGYYTGLYEGQQRASQNKGP